MYCYFKRGELWRHCSLLRVEWHPYPTEKYLCSMSPFELQNANCLKQQIQNFISLKLLAFNTHWIPGGIFLAIDYSRIKHQIIIRGDILSSSVQETETYMGLCKSITMMNEAETQVKTGLTLLTSCATEETDSNTTTSIRIGSHVTWK